MSPKLLNILLILTPLVLYFGYIDPMYTGQPGIVWTPEASIGTLQIKNIQYESTFGKLVSIEDGIKKVSKSYNDVDINLRSKAELMLPDSVDTIKLRNEVIMIGNKVGVALQSVKVDVDQKQNSKALGAYVVGFSLKSNYSTFKSFMELYEKNMRFYVLDSVTIKHHEKKDEADTEDDKDMLSVTILSKVYVLK